MEQVRKLTDHNMKHLLIIITALFSSLALSSASDTSTEAAKEVLTRVMGKEAVKRIELKQIPQKNGCDVYTYESSPQKLRISGSSNIAICRAAYDYIRANNMGTVGWAGQRLSIPAQWPTVPLTHGETPFKIRHCYNVVTAGYSFPYWTWERWQQEIDWLAMHGYNMIMAPVATEAIGTRVWKQLGLTQEEIDAYYTGPAHLPWNRMGNIRQVGGKLTAAWHRDQVALQHKLLKRLRKLGIEPVVQGFAGFVPPAIKRIYPDIKLHNTHWNGGFPMSQRPVVMMPDDPLFKKIMVSFLREWKKEFGSAKYILVDSFNEMQLPKTDKPIPELLAGYGKNTYDAITAEMPDAVWTLQGWMFNYQRNIWNKKTVKALMDSVPNDRLLVLDYANDYNPNWDDFSAFHGKTWVMGYVPNMGAKTALVGRMDFYANQVAKTLADSRHGNLVGFTISGEGIENNEVIYELMSDSAWSSKPVNLTTWLPKYAANRYSSDDPALAEAWHLLHKSVYSDFTPHPSFGWQNGNGLGIGSACRSSKFPEAAQKFLSVASKHSNNANYRDDAVEIGALALGVRCQHWYKLADAYLKLGKKQKAQRYFDQAESLLLEVDKLMESHSLNRLDRWIALARQHQGSAAEKDAYEANARQIITVWGPPVNDYSCRVWSGLIRDFYAPRIRHQFQARLENKRFNRGAWEDQWVHHRKGISTITPYEHPAEMAAKLVKTAYTTPLPPLPTSKDFTQAKYKNSKQIAQWDPSQMNTSWTSVEWDFPAAELKSLKGIAFVFSKGNHRLEIKSVAIIADGNQIAIDEHTGSTGNSHSNNLYTFKLPKNVQANNSCKIRAVIRSAGGTNSNGDIILVR